MYTIITFSPTGNSRYVANELKQYLNVKNEVLENKVFELEKITDISKIKSEHLILVSTIRAFDFPRVVYEFVKAIPDNHYKYVSIIGVGCNREWINSASSLGVKKIFLSKNIPVIVDNTVEMPLNLIKAFPQDVVNTQLEKLENEMIAATLNITNLFPVNRIVPFKAKCLSKVNIIERNAVKLFGLELYANKECVKCGKCVRDCPTKNIRFNGEKVKFGMKCMLCLRCVYECPKNAIAPRFSKFVLIKEGYIPPI